MKKLFLLALILPFAAFSQTSTLTAMADFSDADSNRAHIAVSGKAFDLMSKMEADSVIDEQVKKLASSVKGMDGYMNFTTTTAKEMLQKLDEARNFEQYAEYSTKDGFVRFYMDENNGIVKEMILVAYDQDNGYAASVYGNMDVRDVGKLYRIISMRGFEQLEKNEQK